MAPPACSTAVVSWLTDAPPAGTSSRTVIEYDTDGTALTGLIFSRAYGCGLWHLRTLEISAHLIACADSPTVRRC